MHILFCYNLCFVLHVYYLIATAHSAGPGHDVHVVAYMLLYDEGVLSFGDLGPCWGDL